MKSTHVYSWAAVAIVTGMAVYIMLAISTVFLYHGDGSDVRLFLDDMHREHGISTLPITNTARTLLGEWGVVLVVVAVLSALLTGVMGFHRAAARIIKIMAKAELLPSLFAKTRKDGVATNASLLVLGLSLPTVLIGRVAIGWNSDAASFGATIVFAYTAVCTIASAKGNKWAKAMGWAGFVGMVVIFVALMLPSIFSRPVLSIESYMLLGLWSLSGMVFYWWRLYTDKKHRFGKSTVMWLIVSAILFFSVTLYTQSHLYQDLSVDHEYDHHNLFRLLMQADTIQIATVGIILFFLFSLFTIMIRRERALHNQYVQSEREREQVTLRNEVLTIYNDKLIEQKTEIEQLHFEYDHHNLFRLLMQADTIQIATVGIILFFLFSLFTIMIRRERALHNQYVQSEREREQVTLRNEVLTIYNDKLIEQKTEIEQLHFELQKSIHYAHNIQHSLLTPTSKINKVFPDNFILYKPRDIVSGDFYWVSQVGDFKICVVADCTGHGVPGGFISMLGMTNLNYICSGETSPEVILNKLRQAIIKSLHQDKDAEEDLDDLDNISTDGMDMAVYVVNSRDMTLSFAGANNPLLVVRDGQMQVLRGDKMPIGIFLNMEDFSRHDIQMQKGDVLYTFSDGFQDQFGIESNKKFKSNNLRDFLLSISDKPMSEQAKILNETFERWRGPASNQTDDVLIMGVRL